MIKFDKESAKAIIKDRPERCDFSVFLPYMSLIASQIHLLTYSIAQIVMTQIEDWGLVSISAS